MGDTPSSRYKELQAQAIARLDAVRAPYAIQIQVGSATCENAAGAEVARAEFMKHIRASGRSDIAVRKTGCTGSCSREPIVTVLEPGKLPIKYGGVDREAVHDIFTQHILGGEPVAALQLDRVTEDSKPEFELLFCEGVRCGRGGDWDVRETFDRKLAEHGIDESTVRSVEAQCFGLCGADISERVAHVLVRPSGTLYRLAGEADVDRVVREHLIRRNVQWDLVVSDQPLSMRFFELYGDGSFFNRQARIALRNAGLIDPENLDEYIERDGFLGLAQVLEVNDPDWVIEQIRTSNLRGRGGGGYPTGEKWAMGRAEADPVKYIICNADEGDPGAFMDRSILESDPFSIVEGMAIGGFAIGASQGFLYIRAEYPLAINRIEQAIEACRERGLLGKDIMGSGFDFDLEIRLGAGAFVCGEETALIHSIEGERGQPRFRPPYPTEKGLWGKPTVINNVETFANVPVVIDHGAVWFSRVGTQKSGGTKVFALAGKVRYTGLVEVPMGTTLRQVVEVVGGGTSSGRAIKAVQTGGPAGGCIPASWLDTPVDFDSLMKAGSIMGSGGMIVLDESDCMVDVAKFFMAFSQDESCGKCTPCREGTTRMLEILDRITTGRGSLEDLNRLERLAKLAKKASLCGLGRAAPNPVLSTLEHYRDEYLAHVTDKRCPAHKCRALIHYEIDPEKCVGCTLCARNCPVDCIAGQRQQPHEIDQSSCIRCGKCFEVCRFDAVERA